MINALTKFSVGKYFMLCVVPTIIINSHHYNFIRMPIFFGSIGVLCSHFSVVYQ